MTMFSLPACLFCLKIETRRSIFLPQILLLQDWMIITNSNLAQYDWLLFLIFELGWLFCKMFESSCICSQPAQHPRHNLHKLETAEGLTTSKHCCGANQHFRRQSLFVQYFNLRWVSTLCEIFVNKPPRLCIGWKLTHTLLPLDLPLIDFDLQTKIFRSDSSNK